MKKFNDYKLRIGRVLGAAAVTLAIVSLVERIRKRSGAFGYFIAAAVSGTAALLFTIEKFDWDSQVADLKKFVVDTGRGAQLDHLRSTFMRGHDENQIIDDGTVSYDGNDADGDDSGAEGEKAPEDGTAEE